MKKGYISSFQMGVLEGIKNGLQITENLTGEESVDIEAIFFSSIFQAGVEEFFVDELHSPLMQKSDFVARRTNYLNREETHPIYDEVSDIFQFYLGKEYYKNPEYSDEYSLSVMLTDMLVSSSQNLSLLIPMLSLRKPVSSYRLPDELKLPLETLFSTIESHDTTTPFPKKVIAKENIERFREIVSSDLFISYSKTHSALDDADLELDKTLPTITASATSLFDRNPNNLKLKSIGFKSLKYTPKIIDAVFGKLPGALSEIAVGIGINALENRRRLIIYDFDEQILQAGLSNIARMIKSKE